MFEILGYLGTCLIVLSYCFAGPKLRIINIAASILMVIYALSINAIPVLLSNSLSIIIHFYYLIFKKGK